MTLPIGYLIEKPCGPPERRRCAFSDQQSLNAIAQQAAITSGFACAPCGLTGIVGLSPTHPQSAAFHSSLRATLHVTRSARDLRLSPRPRFRMSRASLDDPGLRPPTMHRDRGRSLMPRVREACTWSAPPACHRWGDDRCFVLNGLAQLRCLSMPMSSVSYQGFESRIHYDPSPSGGEGQLLPFEPRHLT